MSGAQHGAVFVTGASSGLGRAIAEKWLAEGYQVWGTSRRLDRLEALVGNAHFHAVELDLHEGSGALEAYEKAEEASGGFAVIINNAGYGLFGALTEVPQSDWDRQLSAMLTTTITLVRRQIQGLLKSQIPASLVNVSSLAVEFPLPYMSGYNVAKAGLSALSESLLMELTASNVNVIDFRPGDYRTCFNAAMPSASSSGEPSRPTRTARQQTAWAMMEKHLDEAPLPDRAALDVWRAVALRRSGVVRSGGWFQSRLAPMLVRFSPSGLARSIRWRYFGLR